MNHIFFLTTYLLNNNFGFKHRVLHRREIGLSTLAKTFVITFRICLVIGILPRIVLTLICEIMQEILKGNIFVKNLVSTLYISASY